MFIFSMKKSKTRKQKLHTPPEARTLQSLRSKDSEVSARPGQEDGMNMMLLLCNMHGFQTYSGQKRNGGIYVLTCFVDRGGLCG